MSWRCVSCQGSGSLCRERKDVLRLGLTGRGLLLYSGPGRQSSERDIEPRPVAIRGKCSDWQPSEAKATACSAVQSDPGGQR